MIINTDRIAVVLPEAEVNDLHDLDMYEIQNKQVVIGLDWLLEKIRDVCLSHELLRAERDTAKDAEPAILSGELLLLLHGGFEIKLFCNGCGSISAIATNDAVKVKKFVSTDGSVFVDPPPMVRP